MIYERIPVYSGRIKRGGSTVSSMDFVSTVLSLSQEHDKGADSGRAFRRGRRTPCGFGAGRKGGTRYGTRLKTRVRAVRLDGGEGGQSENDGRDGKNARWRERAGIRRNKRGIFVPATNPNGEKRTFLFSFTRQPTYPPTFMSAVSED